MKLGSLFTGGGLGDFGFLAAGMEITWQCEIDEYCQNILSLRYPESIKYRDIKDLKGVELEQVDIITGGFPCQPFSVAGKQKGKDDNRYLWPEMLRVIKECRPRWIVGENVPGIINMALDTVCSDLEAQGYEVWPIVFPSHAIGAWHKRDRLWIVAHTRLSRMEEQEQKQSDLFRRSDKTTSTQTCSDAGLLGQAINEKQTAGSKQLCEATADATSSGQSGGDLFNKARNKSENQQEWENGRSKIEQYLRFWATEPAVGRVANGITKRVDRLKLLGNGQVTACTYVIGRMIMDIENDTQNLRRQ